jgi:hypothetical protein
VGGAAPHTLQDPVQWSFASWTTSESIKTGAIKQERTYEQRTKKAQTTKKRTKKKSRLPASLSPTHTKLRIFGYPSHVHPIDPPNPFISKYDAMFGENSKRLVCIGLFYFGAGGPSPPASRSSKMQQAYAG